MHLLNQKSSLELKDGFYQFTIGNKDIENVVHKCYYVAELHRIDDLKSILSIEIKNILNKIYPKQDIK